MNLDFSEDQRLLQTSLREYLDDNSPLSVAREVLESDQKYSEKLWKGVAELGYVGAAIPEEHGGGGFGPLELALIAEEVGRSLAPIPFASSVYLATEAILLAGTDEQRRKYLPKLATGESIGTLALAEGPGRPGPRSIKTTFDGKQLSGTKVPVLDGEIASLAIVVAREGDGVSLTIADLGADGATRKPIRSIDPSRSQGRIELSRAPAERLGEAGQGWEILSSLLDRAAVLLAFEQIGGAQRALDITTDYTKTRFAFGRAVASFQAIKHRLADLFVDLQLARSNAYYGAYALSSANEELPTAACAARASACEAFDKTCVEMIQMHGGVGFTWEFDCHLFYRRAKLLSLVLGGPGEWQEKLIERLDVRKAS